MSKINHLTVVTHRELAELYNGINDLSRILFAVRDSGECTDEAIKGAGVINSLRQRIGKWSILHAYREDGTEYDGVNAKAIQECNVTAHGMFIIDGVVKPSSDDCPACLKEAEDADGVAREAKADAIYEEARDREAEQASEMPPGVQMVQAAMGYIDKAIKEAREGAGK